MSSKTNQTMHLKTVTIIAVLTLVLAGCTHLINPPKEPYTGYTQQEKIRLKVALNITDELRNAKHETHYTGDNWVIPIGGSIAQNASVLARHIFAEVVETTTGGKMANIPVQAILTPKVAYINRTTGATGHGKSIVSIKVEWTFSDPSGNVIWVETLSAESSGSTGFTNPEKLVKKALEDVLTKSHQAILSSESIRQFALKQQK